jgi:hypothetical protein
MVLSMQETIQIESDPNEAGRIIKEHYGAIRSSQDLKAVIHPRKLYELRDQGELEQVSGSM